LKDAASSSDDIIVPNGDFMLNLPHTLSPYRLALTLSMLEKG